MNSNLKKLSLRENYIFSLPPELALFGRLKYLDLANNNIDTLPEEMEAMKWLSHLDVSKNPCLNNANNCRLLSTIANLETLKINGAGNITDELTLLNKLSHLSASGSSLSGFPSGFVHLKTIELENCDNLNYPNFFKSIKTNDSLEKIVLSSKNLRKLGEELSEMKNLKCLVIKENNLKELPENFGALKQLEEFHIRLNAGKEQTAAMISLIDKCKDLSKLDLSNSLITELPANIGSLNKIKYLSLEGVEIKKVPEGIYTIQNLAELNLRGTGLDASTVSMLENRLSNCNVINDVAYAVPANLQNELFSQAEVFTLNASKPNTVTTMDGTVIKIPANAFVDEKGKTIKNNVTVSFQPFYGPAQIYLSGIEMNYDSGGVSNSFQSAGMFNISANANGRDLALGKQKKIQVDFQSLNPKGNYNFYNYDKNSQNWTYKGRDNIVPSKKNKDTVVTMERNIFNYREMPRRPVRKNFNVSQKQTKIYYTMEEKKGRKKYSFWINRGFKQERSKEAGREDVKDELPQFVNSDYKWIYEVDTNGVDFFRKAKRKERGMFNPGFYKKNSPIKLLEGPQKDIEIYIVPDRSNDRFEIVFKSYNDSVVLTGYPDYGFSSAGKIQEKTKKEFDDYSKDLEKRREVEAQKMAHFKKYLLEYEKEMTEYRKKLKVYNEKELASLNNMPVSEDRITRSLMLDGLGTWNCDIINRLPNGMEIYVKLYDKNERVFPSSLTVIDQTNNGYGSYSSSKIIIDRFVNNVMMVKLKDGRFGYAKFTVSDKDQKDLDLAVNIIETKGLTMKEFSQQVFN